MLISLLIPVMCLVAFIGSIKALAAVRVAAAAKLDELSLDRIAAVADACRRSH